MVEPSEMGPVPRPTRQNQRYVRQRNAWILVAALIGLFLLALVAHFNFREQRLAAHGALTQGRISDHRQTSGKGASQFLTVDFKAAGNLQTEEFEVSPDTYAGYDIDASVPVVFDPQDVTNTSLFAMPQSRADRNLLLSLLIWAVGGGCAGLIYWADVSLAEKQVKMLAEYSLGQLTVERVLPPQPKQFGSVVAGHFVDQHGERREVPGMSYPGEIRMDETIPILYGPNPAEVCALISIGKAELA